MSDGPNGGAPRSFGRFRVARLLGTGGMGEVFLAHDELLGREVAIKTLAIPGFEGALGEPFKARFLNEARAIAALSHPHVVQVFDLGFEGDTPYLVMEVVGGPSLRERLKQGRRLSYAEARALGIQVGGALAAAHARGILHRDVKPANLLEAEPGVWKLADFGVARTPDSSLTVTGQFLGSPAYAAPEALLLAQFSPASDVFSLGATLYEALAGETPYGDPKQADLAAIVQGRPAVAIDERCPDIPPDLARVITKAIARERRTRPTAVQLAAELAGEPPAAVPATDVTRAAVPRALQAVPPTRVAAPPAAPAPADAIVVTVAVPDAGAPLRPGARAAPRPSRVKLLALVAAAAVLILALGIGVGVALSGGGPPGARAPAGGAVDAATRAAPAPKPAGADAGRRAPPAGEAVRPAQRDAAPTPEEREARRQQQWQGIRLKLSQGRIDEGRRDLEDYIKRYPDDEQAPHLLEYLKALPSGGPGSRVIVESDDE